MLSNKEYKALKKFQKNPERRIDCSDGLLQTLESKGCLKFNMPFIGYIAAVQDPEPSYCEPLFAEDWKPYSITQEGCKELSEFERYKSEKRWSVFWTIIAALVPGILALIFGYFKEFVTFIKRILTK